MADLTPAVPSEPTRMTVERYFEAFRLYRRRAAGLAPVAAGS